MAGRALLLLLAAGGAWLGASGLHDRHRCDAARAQALRVGFGAKLGDPQALVARLEHDCRGSQALAAAAGALERAGQLGPALELADEALRREPEDYAGWIAIATALQQRGLTGAAQRALSRARALDPRLRITLAPAPRPRAAAR